MTSQARVFGFIHYAHASTPQLSKNVIVGDSLADHSEGLSAVGGYVRPLTKLRSTLMGWMVVNLWQVLVRFATMARQTALPQPAKASGSIRRFSYVYLQMCQPQRAWHLPSRTTQRTQSGPEAGELCRSW